MLVLHVSAGCEAEQRPVARGMDGEGKALRESLQPSTPSLTSPGADRRAHRRTAVTAAELGRS